MKNYLAINCSVELGLGKLTIVILTEKEEVYKYVFKSPSVFSFKRNSAEILNWHRDNIISLITQFNIDGIAVKKSERTSFRGNIKNSDIFKLYMEGVMLGLAGHIGKSNKHYYKQDIKKVLEEDDIFSLSLDEICEKLKVTNELGFVPSNDLDLVKETVLTVLALRKNIEE